MSSSSPIRARAARLGLAGTAVALVVGCAGCGAAEPESGAAATTGAAVAVTADDTTRLIAQVEFVRQCTIATTPFVDEADMTVELDARLAAAGLTHLQWKQWHDALADSPDLVEQFAGISSVGCTGA